MPLDIVAEEASEANLSYRVFVGAKEAYQEAIRDSSPSDIIFVGGSTFIVADFLELVD